MRDVWLAMCNLQFADSLKGGAGGRTNLKPETILKPETMKRRTEK